MSLIMGCPTGNIFKSYIGSDSIVRPERSERNFDAMNLPGSLKECLPTATFKPFFH